MSTHINNIVYSTGYLKMTISIHMGAIASKIITFLEFNKFKKIKSLVSI